MTSHEAYVTARFDALEARFKATVRDADYRLRALLRVLGPLAGQRILDAGCGKGRFARRLRDAGADVVALDPSAAMLRHASGVERVRATARRLPLVSDQFDGVIAVEMLEHVDVVPAVLEEFCRVLRPGGLLAIVDKSVFSLNVQRPWLPGIAVKWIDERRGCWMYPAGAPVRERWFRPRILQKQLGSRFESPRVEYLLSEGESARAVFRMIPAARQMVLWTARKPGGCLG